MPQICSRRGFDILALGLEMERAMWHQMWQLRGAEISIQMTARVDGGPEFCNHQELNCTNNLNGQETDSPPGPQGKSSVNTLTLDFWSTLGATPSTSFRAPGAVPTCRE